MACEYRRLSNYLKKSKPQKIKIDIEGYGIRVLVLKLTDKE